MIEIIKYFTTPMFTIHDRKKYELIFSNTIVILKYCNAR